MSTVPCLDGWAVGLCCHWPATRLATWQVISCLIIQSLDIWNGCITIDQFEQPIIDVSQRDWYRYHWPILLVISQLPTVLSFVCLSHPYDIIHLQSKKRICAMLVAASYVGSGSASPVFGLAIWPTQRYVAAGLSLGDGRWVASTVFHRRNSTGSVMAVAW